MKYKYVFDPDLLECSKIWENSMKSNVARIDVVYNFEYFIVLTNGDDSSPTRVVSQSLNSQLVCPQVNLKALTYSITYNTQKCYHGYTHMPSWQCQNAAGDLCLKYDGRNLSVHLFLELCLHCPPNFHLIVLPPFQEEGRVLNDYWVS